MTLTEFFKKVIQSLENENVDYALAGGLVASIYRSDERITNDLDFLIFAEGKTQRIASSIIEQFELVPHIVRKADLEGGRCGPERGIGQSLI